MMGAARAAIALLLFLLVLPVMLEVFPRFFRDVVPGGSVTPAMGVALNILFLLFLFGLGVRLSSKLRGGGPQGAHRDAAERRARVAPRYRAEDVPAPIRSRPGPADDDPELDLLGK
jgi:hypothetical protein